MTSFQIDMNLWWSLDEKLLKSIFIYITNAVCARGADRNDKMENFLIAFFRYLISRQLLVKLIN